MSSSNTIEALMQQLQATAQPLTHVSDINNDNAPEFLFKITYDSDSITRAYVETVNNRGRHVVVDASRVSGPAKGVLTMLDRIKQTQRQMLWSDANAPIILGQHPQLIERLTECHNVVGEDLRPITVCPGEHEMLLLLDNKGNDYLARFGILDEKGVTTDVRLLGEQWALTTKGIYHIKPLGEHYDTLPRFAITFDKAQLDVYLSALYSYLTNVRLHNLPYKVTHLVAPAPSQPTLVFESVDSDMTLCMRLSASVANDSDVDTSSLTMQVIVDHEARMVTMRHIEHIDVTQEAKALYQVLSSCAPSRAALRDVYIKEVENHDCTSSDTSHHYYYSLPPIMASAFLTTGLPAILGRYHLVGSDKLLNFKVRPVKPRISVSLSSGIDFLEGTATVNIEGNELMLSELMSQYKQNHYITLTDGNRAIIDEQYMQRLVRLFDNATKRNGKVRISFFDLPEVEAMIGERLQGAAVERSHKVYEGFNKLATQRMQFKQVNANLRNYQKEGVKWLNYLYENQLGGCLADDMGLGKTLQTIAMLARIYPKVTEPSLIVMPRSLLFNWENELRRFAPQLTFYTYYGPQRDLDEALKNQLVLTTYALTRNDVEQLLKHEFHYVVLDESQNIKNVTAQTTKAVTLLKCKHRLALSGTPIENNLTELYSLFRFLNPAMFGSLNDFNRKYTVPIQNDLDQNAAATLRRKVFPFILRRLKGDVLTELPARTDQTLTVEMSTEHQQFYESRRRFYEDLINNKLKSEGLNDARFMMLRALGELRQAASIPESLTEGQIEGAKIAPLLDSLAEAIEAGHKVVVFFNFIAGIELVGNRLDNLGIDYAVMTGSTNDRRSVVERFQNDPQCMALLMTVKTGGVGLNLTNADTVYIFEPWWNKAAEEQAINRLHRIGQKAKVLSYSIIVHDTIEEKIRLLQQKKTELTDAIISSDTAMAKHLSEEDIRYILS